MAQTKNALIRYRTIDTCLQNCNRQWTLSDLIDACSDALYEYEGRDVNVSKRTIQLDIQMMRSDKLGYNAPIEVYHKKFYRYADPDYSITDIPLTESDMHVLSESVEMLKQFKDFSLFSELGGIIQRLEDKVYSEKTHQSAVIHLDKNDNLKGLEHLDTLYQAILKKLVLKIKYQSFTARSPSTFTFYPFLLKEFNNRWFLVGKPHQRKTQSIVNLALDRILAIDFDTTLPFIEEAFDGDLYYQHTIGVTVLNDDQLQTVIFKLDSKNAPYVITKPFHQSQQILETRENGDVVFTIRVHLNFELERLLLGFGDSLEVLAPRQLRKRIRKKIERLAQIYSE